jgi:hypothetical protein
MMESCFLHRDKEIKDHMIHIFKVNPIIHIKYLSALIHCFSFLLQQTILIRILTKGESPSISRKDWKIKFENELER